MRRFGLKLLLYALPIAAYGLVAFGLPLYAGEFTPVRQVIAEQTTSSEPLLFGRAYRDDSVAYKLLSTQVRQAQLLILGSSRVMQFRSNLVDPRVVSFYNAGGGTNAVAHLREFVQLLPADATPQVIILGLDQDWFNAAHVDVFPATPATALNQTGFDNRWLLNTGRTAMTDWLTGRWSFGRLAGRQDPITQDAAIGINAIVTGSGFRPDGSRQYGALLADPTTTPERLADVQSRIREGRARFEYADQFSPAAIAELELFLDLCASRGITVIAVSPPYAPSIYAEMLASGRYSYIPSLTAHLAQLFAARGLAYFDFSNGSLPGVTDDNFIDGFHGSEIVYTAMYVHLAEARPDLLGAYSDVAALRALLQQPRPSDLQLFDDD